MNLADEAFEGATGNFLDLYWMLGDHQGSVTSVLSHNNGQTSLVQQLAYTAFGSIGSIKDGQGNNITTGPISRFAYTGREFDPETGDYYYRARYYDPQSGRFLSQDPIGFAAGDMNLYRYVGNTTPNAIDPNGLERTWWQWYLYGDDSWFHPTAYPASWIINYMEWRYQGEELEVEIESKRKLRDVYYERIVNGECDRYTLEQIRDTYQSEEVVQTTKKFAVEYTGFTLSVVLLQPGGSEWSRLISQWDKSSFPSIWESILYHAQEHGGVLNLDDVLKYLRRAENFNTSGANKTIRPDGTVKYERKSGEFLITRDKKIVSYGKNCP